MQLEINLNELMEKIYAKVNKELILANNEGKLQDFIKKYGLEDEYTEYSDYNERDARIIIIGDIQVNKNDLFGIAKNYGIDRAQIDFVDYEECTNYNFTKLQYSNVYSDMLVGPMPHSNNGMNGYESFIDNVKHNQEKYPKMIILNYGGQVKITKSSLKEGFEKTRYYQQIVNY